MRVAPPVQALSCGAGAWQAAQCALVALSAGTLACWAGLRWLEGGTGVVLGSIAIALAVAIPAWRMQAQLPRQLRWDGSTWAVLASGGEPQPGQVTVMIDLGGWMLVRFVPLAPRGAGWGRSIWLPLSCRDAGASWIALRTALYATRPAASIA